MVFSTLADSSILLVWFLLWQSFVFVHLPEPWCTFFTWEVFFVVSVHKPHMIQIILKMTYIDFFYSVNLDHKKVARKVNSPLFSYFFFCGGTLNLKSDWPCSQHVATQESPVSDSWVLELHLHTPHVAYMNIFSSS